MKLLIWPLLLVAAWIGHGRLMFTESRVMPLVTQNTMQVFSGDNKACDFYTDDVQVDLESDQRAGRWEVEGGKDELCGYLRKAAAAFVLLDAQVHTEYSDVKLERKGFPWTEATLHYTEHVTVQTDKLPTMTFTSDDELILVRTLTGVKVRSVHSRGTQR